MTFSDKLYTGLCGLFAVLIVVGNVTYQKFVSLPIFSFHTFELSVGAIFYPITFLLTDLIAEFYGKEKAGYCVKIGLIMNITAALIIACMDMLPATDWSKIDGQTFHNIFGFYSVAFIGSILACYIAQAFDIILYLWIKKITKGKYLWLRNCGSTAISLLIDTTIVITFLSFFGVLPKDRMVALIINSYSFKLFFSICNTPFFYIFVSGIRHLLKSDPIARQKN